MDTPKTSPWSSTLGLLLFPFFVFLFVFWLIPLGTGITRSLYEDPQQITSADTADAPTLTLKNFTDLTHDAQYRKALVNTATYAFCSILIIVFSAFVLAHLLKSCHPAIRPVFTFGLIIPGLAPPVILGLLFLMVFHGKHGLLNTLTVEPLWGLVSDTPTRINWLKDPAFIMLAMLFQGVWRWTGFITLFFLCGLEAIPKTYYEAARMEGAGVLHRIRYVSLPCLKPVILFAIVYLLIDAVSMFSGAYALLGGSGGTDDAGLLLVSYAYFTGFKFHNPASATAISLSVVPFLLILIWAILFRMSRREINP